ncbi:MAG: hypothetical protein ABI647_00835 [Gemmatimonadota bacterium]
MPRVPLLPVLPRRSRPQPGHRTLTVGRRSAFDSANGRLWVVCKKCDRWNLTPLGDRSEALDADFADKLSTTTE